MATDTQQEHGMKMAEPQEEHDWLQRLVGDWTYEVEVVMEPGGTPDKFSGTESVRSLGGLWVVAEGKGETPGGGEATTILTLGYDPQRQRYVGSWVGSMMTHMWVYEGERSADRQSLALNTQGPDMITEGQTANYQEVIEFKSDDHRTFTSYMLRPDGTKLQLMLANYRRRR